MRGGADVTPIAAVESVSGVSLEQNIPNPFHQTTTINYTLPETFSSAKIVIVDNTGRVLQQHPLYHPGKESLDIETSKLMGVGVYFYSLYVDDKLADTKKMIKSK